MRKIRVGSRESRLAVRQSELVMDASRARHPELELELVSGPQEALEALAETLSARYALPRCTRSKQARALALGQEDER